MRRFIDWLKRQFVDKHPWRDESHSATRYALTCENCCESDGNGHPGGSCCVACMEEGDGQ